MGIFKGPVNYDTVLKAGIRFPAGRGDFAVRDKAFRDRKAANMENSAPPRKYTEAEIKDENKRIRHLRRLVDFSLAFIAQSPMSLEEAHRTVQAVRKQAMILFPGKEETFDLIYKPRFRRLIAEKFSLL